jgi:GT2 family glycosyltransferase
MSAVRDCQSGRSVVGAEAGHLAGSAPSSAALSAVAAVVIGRNEGERLMVCLGSLLRSLPAERIVYVDSGSIDGSVDRARGLGVQVHALDPSRPFSAARARNEGFEQVASLDQPATLVQFVDGDCEVLPEWFAAGVEALSRHPEVASVCGRTLERHRNATIYNRLCDIEFDVPAGEVRSTGGIFLIRAEAFAAVGGMRTEVVAGEEPEMCLRLREAGWRIRRLSDPMVLHDSAITRFRQWWVRAKRGGVAVALGHHLHGRRSGERFCRREWQRMLVWGLAMPLLAIGLAWPTLGLSVAAYLLLLVAQWLRTAWGVRRGGKTWGDALWYGLSCVVAKFPQALGVIGFQWDRLRGRHSGIVEYK